MSKMETVIMLAYLCIFYNNGGVFKTLGFYVCKRLSECVYVCHRCDFLEELYGMTEQWPVQGKFL